MFTWLLGWMWDIFRRFKFACILYLISHTCSKLKFTNLVSRLVHGSILWDFQSGSINYTLWEVLTSFHNLSRLWIWRSLVGIWISPSTFWRIQNVRADEYELANGKVEDLHLSEICREGRYSFNCCYFDRNIKEYRTIPVNSLNEVFCLFS